MSFTVRTVSDPIAAMSAIRQAVALVCIVLYGVMSYNVTRRTHEIGVRMALGEQSGDVLRMALRESLLLVLTGSLIGLATALATARLIARMLF